jgi:hypothetical protein
VIILSGVLVVLAIALLVTGIVTGNTGHEVAGLDGLKLIYVSIGVSIIASLCLAIGVFLRRKELFGSAQAPARKSAASRSAKAARTAKAKARVGAGDDVPATTALAATVAEVPADTKVYTVPGRKRYHLETCRQLAGRDKEELTFVEAREEGFTACTACLPDTALAARAALTETVGTAPTETLDPATDTAAGTADLAKAADDEDTAEDAATDTREIEPAAESPAAGAFTETPEPEVPEPETAGEGSAADTVRFDEVSDAEGASGPAAEERPLARSRSLFDPPDRSEPSAAAESEAQEPDAEEAEVAEPVNGTASVTAADRPAAPAEDDEAPEPVDGTDAAPAAGKAGAPDAGALDDTGVDPDLPYVRILSGTRRYHRPECALIEDIAEDADDLESLSTMQAKERGCTPCLVCQPDKSPSSDLR